MATAGVDRNEFFREVTVRLCSRLDIENGLCSCLRYMGDLVPADRLSLQLFEAGFGAMRVFARASAEKGERLDVVVPLSLIGRSEMGEGESQILAFPEHGVFVDNGPESPTVLRMLEFFNEPPSSVMILPLMVDNIPLGAAVVVAHGSNRFTAHHAELMSCLKQPFFMALSNALEHQRVIDLKERLADDNRFLRRELTSRSEEAIVGSRFGLAEVMTLAEQVAPRTCPVLLLGETGTGKDLIAHAIHGASPRRERPFVGVNCGAIPETLVDSELFGHEKGAFTGALKSSRGRFERAHGGTIFLDEVGELTPAAQVRLLRVLQSGEMERVGSTGPLHVDVRVIAATHRNLEQMVSDGRFRQDLWFRLNVFPIRIPPLRDRKLDIPALAHHFIAVKSKHLKLIDTPTMAPSAIDRLMDYPWPGNVRELQNVIERALIVGAGEPLTFNDLVPQSGNDDPHTNQQADGPTALDEVVASHIKGVLTRCDGKIHGPGGAAELLRINPSTLRNKMKKLGISRQG